MARTYIYAIVPIDPDQIDPEELIEDIAVEQADTMVFSDLVGDSSRKPFDGSDTWSENSDPLLRPRLVDSPEGQAYIQEALADTRKEFREMMGKIRAALAKLSDDDFLDWPAANNPDFPAAHVRFLMTRVGDWRGPEVHLYSHEADGLFNQASVDEAINAAKSYCKYNGGENQAWVVPARVHF